jgi:hypothetical protein
VLKRLIHVQPLKLRLFPARDDVDVIAASETMIKDAEQGVTVRRIVHADGVASARQSVVHKTGCLMAEPIVIVAPCMAGEQNI